ncbi:MAG: nitroreductase family protein [Thermoguttaceae bacterium]
MSHIRLDHTDCVRCGRCSLTCPIGIFAMKGDPASPEIVEGRETACVRCYHCVATCPVAAISVDDITASMCPDMTTDQVPRFSQIAYLIRARRSIRSYDSKAGITRQQIEQLLDVVRWAPTARNTGQIKWVVVLGHDKVAQLSDFVIDSLNGTEWGTALTSARTTGIDPVLRGAAAVVCAYTESDNGWSMIDSTIAATSLDLAANALGISTCWAGILVRAAQSQVAVGEWLGLHDPQKVYAALMLGYPGRESFSRIPYRNEQPTQWVE